MSRTMEPVPEAPDESSGNSLSVKSEDGSHQHDGGRSSPPPNCAICLGRCRNKSFTDSCLHQFCFKCLLTWSRVKTECPLCKQNFKSIIHNVKSNHQYEEYLVDQPHNEDRAPSIDINEIVNAARRFRYRTTLTLPRRDTLAIQQFLMHYPLAAIVNDLPHRGGSSRDPSRFSPSDFRRTVYRHNLWAQPLPDFTGRYRDCTPTFFQYNTTQMHRLVPWLNRELYYLLNENIGHISYVVRRIMQLLPMYPIVSPEFRVAISSYLGERTNHFLHEFHVFASTPYDITGYDRHVQYRTEARTAGLVSEVLSSSDSDSRDSDIMMVASSHPGPSRPPPAAASAPALPPAVIPIETISHSDSDSDSEVMVVGYIKPPHQRTPELVDLLGSDSDVVVQEPGSPDAARRAAPSSPVVRVKMSVPSLPDSSDGDTEPYEPPSRLRSTARLGAQCDNDTYAFRTPPFSSDDEGSYEDTTDSSSSEDGWNGNIRMATTARGRWTCIRPVSKRKTRQRTAARRAEKNRKRKGKSRNGKGVKSSSVNLQDIPLPPAPAPAPAPAPPQPGPSGAAPVAGSKRKSTAEPESRRASRESKRLKSVVKVMKTSDQSAGADSNPVDRDVASSDSKRRPKPKLSAETRKSSRSHARADSSSSSDDNIPLRLAMSRMHAPDVSD